MYLYDDIDQRLVDEMVAQFRDQTRRFLDGMLSEDDFRQLRLRNGLYVQRYAPMLRTQLPEVWMACIWTVASSARISGTSSSFGPLSCRFWRVEKWP